jgi:hypothetical protein
MAEPPRENSWGNGILARAMHDLLRIAGMPGVTAVTPGIDGTD